MRASLTPLERFLLKVELPQEPNGCWLWRARLSPDGYGRFNRGPGISPLAHRYSYELFVGPIPDGKQIDHLCRNRACVKPEHLEAVTPHENWNRGESPSAVNSRRDTCVNGHPFTPENTIDRKRAPGQRACRMCARAANRRYRKRLRAAAAA